MAQPRIDGVHALMVRRQSNSVSRGFAEVAAVVVATEEFVGFGVYGDEFAVAPDAGVSVVGGLVAVGFVAHGLELIDDVVGKLLFEVETVWEVLVVEARGVGDGLDVEVVVDGADDVVGNSGDDSGAAGGSHDVGELCVVG